MRLKILKNLFFLLFLILSASGLRGGDPLTLEEQQKIVKGLSEEELWELIGWELGEGSLNQSMFYYINGIAPKYPGKIPELPNEIVDKIYKLIVEKKVPSLEIIASMVEPKSDLGIQLDAAIRKQMKQIEPYIPEGPKQETIVDIEQKVDAAIEAALLSLSTAKIAKLRTLKKEYASRPAILERIESGFQAVNEARKQQEIPMAPEIIVQLQGDKEIDITKQELEQLGLVSKTINDLLADLSGTEVISKLPLSNVSQDIFVQIKKYLEVLAQLEEFEALEKLEQEENIKEIKKIQEEFIKTLINDQTVSKNLPELIGVANFLDMPKLLYTLVEISVDLLIREISKFGKSECFDQLSIIVNEYEQLPIEITRLISKKLIAAMTKLALPDNELKKKIIDILLGKKQYSNVTGVHSDLSKFFLEYDDRLDLIDLSSGNVTQYQGATKVFSWSPDSTKIFLKYIDRLDLLDLSSGNVTQYQGATGIFLWSPNSTKIFLKYEDRFDLLDLSSENASVTQYQRAKAISFWSPDSTKIFLKYVDRLDLIDLSSGNADVTQYQGVTKVSSWSSDSTKIFLEYVDRLDLLDLSSGNADVTQYQGATKVSSWSPDSTKVFLKYEDRDGLIDFFRPDLSIFQVLFLIWIIQEDAGIKNLPKYLGDLFNDLPEKIKEEITPGIQEELSGLESEEEEQLGKRRKTGKEEE